MACDHNKDKIEKINAEIEANKKEIDNHQNNIDKCTQIINNHNNFVTELDCVIQNLDDNNIQTGVPYDEGKMTVCRDQALETIDECNNIQTKSNEAIEELNAKNAALAAEKENLQGDCETCKAAALAAASYNTNNKESVENN